MVPTGTLMYEILGRCGGLQLRERLGVPFAIVILLIFAGVGIDAIINPRRHMNCYLRSGGELLREWNETAVRFAGLVFGVAP
jgi:hypothetical protein